ncbi:MAG: ribosomal protein L32 [Parcubacteria bacterium C7867-001]|nr:MAG: ribosomal protein L32 [Parcubacteria bacterium C7867-001]
MSVRMRHTSSHTKNRRSHHALKNKVIVADKESGKLRLPHRLDESTGMYRGKLIVPERVKAVKEDAKHKKAQKEGRAEKHEVHSHVEEVVKPAKTKAAGKSEAKARAGKGDK